MVLTLMPQLSAGSQKALMRYSWGRCTREGPEPQCPQLLFLLLCWTLLYQSPSGKPGAGSPCTSTSLASVMTHGGLPQRLAGPLNSELSPFQYLASGIPATLCLPNPNFCLLVFLWPLWPFRVQLLDWLAWDTVLRQSTEQRWGSVMDVPCLGLHSLTAPDAQCLNTALHGFLWF